MKSYNQWLESLGSERRVVVSQDKHMLAESAYDSTRLESIDGNLHKYLVHFSLIKKYSESEIISSEHRRLFFSMLDDLRKIIRDARKVGYDWIFLYEDVEPDGKYFKLPSVDLAELIGADTNNKLEVKFKELGIDSEGIIWDTESSAWYPLFKTKEHAARFIDQLNEILDKLYIKQ